MTKRIIIAGIITVISLGLSIIMQASVATAEEESSFPMMVPAPLGLTTTTVQFEPITIITGITFDSLPVITIPAGDLIAPPLDEAVDPDAPAEEVVEPEDVVEPEGPSEETTTTTEAPSPSTTTTPATVTETAATPVTTATTNQASTLAEDPDAGLTEFLLPTTTTDAVPTTVVTTSTDDTIAKSETGLDAQAIDSKPAAHSSSDQNEGPRYPLLGLSGIFLIGAGALIKNA